ncbi:unnamed protein product [Cylicocyclus nassatus]|uniref:Uncharacterized protein n=1 Tax=Cylicocyclus nassatus TaxID=53992 RepID=A0AA36GUU2_CYLNA|nr:unnamed protein product [Cylicocyclus nassatus]
MNFVGEIGANDKRLIFRSELACVSVTFKDRSAGDDEAQLTDENFCTVLEHGLPPTAVGDYHLLNGNRSFDLILTDSNNVKRK